MCPGILQAVVPGVACGRGRTCVEASEGQEDRGHPAIKNVRNALAACLPRPVLG